MEDVDFAETLELAVFCCSCSITAHPLLYITLLLSFKYPYN